MDHKLSYILHLGDNALILGQRLSEWCGHGPVLEQDMAMTNLSLDLIGQARSLYQLAADLDAKGKSEDDYAFLRDAIDFKSVLLVEQENGDFAKTVLRQFLFDAYNFHLYTALCNSSFKGLADIAQKSLKEIKYHLRWSSEWVIRLGDGTQESHARMVNALNELWPYTGELTTITDYEKAAFDEAVCPDPRSLVDPWNHEVTRVFSEAGLEKPVDVFMHKGGKEGVHTELLGYILAEMQFLQRAYPGQEW